MAYDNDFDETYDYAEEHADVPEFNVYQRVGRSALATYSLKGAKNPFEKFKIKLSIDLEKTHSALNLTPLDRDNMFKFAARAPNIIFKNTACFILGYVASNGGKEITEKSLKTAFRGIKNIQSAGTFEGIEEPDVLRYAVYWKNNNDLTK